MMMRLTDMKFIGLSKIMGIYFQLNLFVILLRKKAKCMIPNSLMKKKGKTIIVIITKRRISQTMNTLMRIPTKFTRILKLITLLIWQKRARIIKKSVSSFLVLLSISIKVSIKIKIESLVELFSQQILEITKYMKMKMDQTILFSLCQSTCKTHINITVINQILFVNLLDHNSLQAKVEY